MSLSVAVTNHQGTRTISKRRKLTALVGLLLLLVAATQGSAQATTLPQAYTISGRVTDGFSNGIGGATVTLSGTQTGTTTGDSSGNYSFANLQAGGNYYLSASKPGGYLGWVVSVNNLNSDLTQNLRLDFFVTFNIRVTDASNNGLSAVVIRVNDEGVGFAQTNSFGNCNLSVSVAVIGDTLIKLVPEKPGYFFNPASLTFHSQNGNQVVNFTGALTGLPVSFVQFLNPQSYVVGEGDGSITITVTRTGDTSTAVSCFYMTFDTPTATQKSDYIMAAGTLNFAPGETSKTFQVLIIDNAYQQGNHTFVLKLANPTGGASLGDLRTAGVTIIDNDTGAPTTNPLDNAQFFVRQHYYDFLDRLPDQTGLDYWTSRFAHCGADANCLNDERVGVSAAFFVEQEFQQTGFVVYRFNMAALGLVPDYTHFMVDRNRLIGGSQLQQSTAAYASDFVQSGVFTQFYPSSLTPGQFVNQLFDTAGLTPYTTERQQEIQALSDGSKTRAQVLLDVIEMPEFKMRVYNPAFVLMQYYGFLRRGPEPSGSQFWLNILNNKLPNDPSGYRAMVCAFITSVEYQDRFSSVRTHSNADCGP